MGRESQSAKLNVYMNGILVGILERLTTSLLEFTYADEWMQMEESRPLSLSMPLFTKKHSGDVVRNYLDNLLPDNQKVLDRIQARLKIGRSDSFDILAEIGNDCVGAIQLVPYGKNPCRVRNIEGKLLSDHDIAKILKNYRTEPLGMDDSDDFRISLAGAQEKTALLKRNEDWYRPEGSTPTTHIIKLPIGYIRANNIDLSESVENEWLCHLILKAFGLAVANMDIVQFEDMKVLSVERFDRKLADDKSWIIRLPQEDFCQITGTSPSLKYEKDGRLGIERIMEILRGSSNSQEDRHTFMKTVFLFWVMGAVDGHAKNFSIRLNPQGAYNLTPIYDVISIYPSLAKKEIHPSKIKMAMAVVGTNKQYLWERIHVSNWIRTADACNFSTEAMKGIVKDVIWSMDDVIANVRKQLPENFPSHIAEPIFNYMQDIKIKCIQNMEEI
ncbi:type II toxin-antitoxin system HipA family toxin [Seleniivibrio woodruffii]|uniref:Serine/threonine-protein kinase HipA n=1 Tax=Seleniivibrio woodruffii TaxID=1078050 RepID=A0A4R1KBL8_9BACT|nr:type II toxin-antitoxin system HipA family toxin [Seleniivibrio woodruffii]TCK61958.1 serine/threonine-protein kinase HipA [Seleniivibrio woodruffii]TVZ34925.1 serine/threonine-protein kinase HipA [Seleniivibrio woodruffii]